MADNTSRGRIADLADDVYVFSNVRYFVGEIVEGIISEQWCDCKLLKVIPPTQEEIDKGWLISKSFSFLVQISKMCAKPQS